MMKGAVIVEIRRLGILEVLVQIINNVGKSILMKS